MKLSLGDRSKLYASIGWGVLVVFSLSGAVLGNPASPYVLCITVVMWAAMRILREAWNAIFVLKMIKEHEKSEPKR